MKPSVQSAATTVNLSIKKKKKKLTQCSVTSQNMKIRRTCILAFDFFSTLEKVKRSN